MWIHNDDTLSFVGPTNAAPSAPYTSRVWVMTDALQKDLCIEGVDIGSGRQGIQVILPIVVVTLNPGLTGNITARVKDETFVLAEHVQPFTGPERFSTWNLNFTSQRTTCTVLKGHKLNVDISSTASISVYDWRDAHLAFRAVDPLLPDGHTENSGGPAGAFYPNDIDGSREVMLKGSLGNAFTDVFVSVVRVTVKNPSGNAVQNATAALSTGNWSYTWAYPRTTAGAYSVDIQAEDTQGHTYNATTSFAFVPYGLRINTQGMANGSVSRYTTQGQAADYDLTITNVGGAATTVLLVTENSAPPGWTSNFSRNNIPLEPGAANNSVFRVTPSPSIGPGNSSQITVVAIANDDPAAIKARATVATTTIIEREIFLIISPSRTAANVKLGGLASYDFTITNNGGLATDVTFNATAAPSGWVRALAGIGLITEGDGWRLGALGAGASAVLTLEVQAPGAATGTTEFDCTVSARSVENASAVASFLGSTHLLLGIELIQVSPPPPPPPAVGEPGGFVDFQFEVTNTDPIANHWVNATDVRVEEADLNPQGIHGIAGGSISVAAPIGCCLAATSQVLGVSVTLPQEARAGDYQLTLFVRYDNDDGKVAQLNFTIHVGQVTSYWLRLQDSPSQLRLKGGTVTVDGALVSRSNYPVSVDLDASVLKGEVADTSWTVTLMRSDGTELPGRLVLQPYSEVAVKITINASQSAFNGEHRDFSFRIALALSGLQPWKMNPPVDLVLELDSMQVLTRMWQQSFVLIALFFLLAVGSVWMAIGALRGPKPPRLAAPPTPATAPAKAQGAEDAPSTTVTSAAVRPKA